MKIIVGLAATATLACGTAHADRVAVQQRPILLPSSSAPSPYRVELIDGVGRQLPTYSMGRRFYVLGNNGNRYSIRVHNPTGRRIEAVVSVDGLDVIDGNSANYRSKRGYVVQPHDSITIEGYRTSTSQVAAFRFSSVANSYAGRKGKARNVGVIGVAIFEEKAAAAMIHPHRHGHRQRFGDYRDYLENEADAAPRAGGRRHDKAGRSKQASRKRPASPPTAMGETSGASADDMHVRESRPAPVPPYERPRYQPKRSERPGLGTQFGERRHSAVSWTRFQRKSSRPDAMAQLRYNNATGLAAMGIHIHTNWDHEVATRETANPFPGSFASPPPSWR